MTIWHCDDLTLRRFDIVTIWHCDDLTMWRFDIVTIWHCDDWHCPCCLMPSTFSLSTTLHHSPLLFTTLVAVAMTVGAVRPKHHPRNRAIAKNRNVWNCTANVLPVVIIATIATATPAATTNTVNPHAVKRCRPLWKETPTPSNPKCNRTMRKPDIQKDAIAKNHNVWKNIANVFKVCV